MTNKTKIKKIYSLFIKIAIIIIAFWFIYRRIFIKENLDDLATSLTDIFRQKNFLPTLIMVSVLMLLNWGTESMKWRYMINKIEKVPFLKSVIAVFSGITVSIFTPNRIGEYAGRVFVLEKADRWEGVLITVLGSISQLLITIIIGSVCFIFFVYKYIDLTDSPSYIFYGLILIVSVLIFVLLLLFFNASLMTNLVNKLPARFRKLRHYGLVFSYFKWYELFHVLLFSLTRYFIFITQFYLLLRVYNINMPYIDALVLISMIYLVMAAIPTITLTELGIRGSVSIYFISLFFGDPTQVSASMNMGILAASSTLWLINLAVPAVLGSLFIFKLKFFR